MYSHELETSAPPRKAIPWAIVSVAMLALAGMVGFAVFYHGITARVDRLLVNGPFHDTASYFAAPEILSVGDPMSPGALAAALKRCGLSFTATGGGLLVNGAIPVEIRFSRGTISSIVDQSTGRSLAAYDLPAQLITNLSTSDRSRRLMIHYADLPPDLIHAIISAEDKHFFAHQGFDVFRIGKALYVDMRQHRKEQGASTISMQLARNLWLARDKSWKRKMREALITWHLEHKLSKQQIFEDYCNTVYLGDRGTFAIHGFGEAARAYFSKDVQKLDLTEAATLAGLIQRPSYLNPFRYPDRVRERRNIVLALMRDNKYISEAGYQNAVAAPLRLQPAANDVNSTQYFLDLAGDEASKRLEQLHVGGSADVYTTIDLRLQQAAEHAIANGMQLVDKELAARRRPGQRLASRPQVALIALDPHTGEIKALSGGRSYAESQFNRVLSRRPPGSVFKPFVYTAALNTAVLGGEQVLTPATPIDDAPATFQIGSQTYAPNNFAGEFMGHVTLRYALAHSLNVAAVKVGEMAGLENVVAIARQAGMHDDIQPTPALALGAYGVSPLEIAGAYTIFANDGMHVQPEFVSAIRDQTGSELYDHRPEARRVLDPRIAFLMTDMLQEVTRSGTAAGVRSRGFRLPAAGKTGTSHDGWFAGFTSQLLCVVWVGFDDYTELGLEGARSALPIWTDFMLEAARYKQYGEAKPFAPPPGVVQVAIDPRSGNLAGPDCPGMASYFIQGTQPRFQCAPQEIELSPTADGGFTQRVVPATPAVARTSQFSASQH